MNIVAEYMNYTDACEEANKEPDGTCPLCCPFSQRNADETPERTKGDGSLLLTVLSRFGRLSVCLDVPDLSKAA